MKQLQGSRSCFLLRSTHRRCVYIYIYVYTRTRLLCIIHNSPGGLLNLHNPGGSQGFEFEPKPWCLLPAAGYITLLGRLKVFRRGSLNYQKFCLKAQLRRAIIADTARGRPRPVTFPPRIGRQRSRSRVK